jgi:hypothetical protein
MSPLGLYAWYRHAPTVANPSLVQRPLIPRKGQDWVRDGAISHAGVSADRSWATIQSRRLAKAVRRMDSSLITVART